MLSEDELILGWERELAERGEVRIPFGRKRYAWLGLLMVVPLTALLVLDEVLTGVSLLGAVCIVPLVWTLQFFVRQLVLRPAPLVVTSSGVVAYPATTLVPWSEIRAVELTPMSGNWGAKAMVTLRLSEQDLRTWRRSRSMADRFFTPCAAQVSSILVQGLGIPRTQLATWLESEASHRQSPVRELRLTFNAEHPVRHPNLRPVELADLPISDRLRSELREWGGQALAVRRELADGDGYVPDELMHRYDAVNDRGRRLAAHLARELGGDVMVRTPSDH